MAVVLPQQLSVPTPDKPFLISPHTPPSVPSSSTERLRLTCFSSSLTTLSGQVCWAGRGSGDDSSR
ncbi:hypothetical protein E2C01_011681 [Portunus trituberculatus]|uniref:Uncharacterized protein n=1 Tax=Portunus trituberculatus TaxID=210409 RepID=A0A5B7DBS3_PORTR|nr:hypothetical protein [Portunus trituberculatus]